jgi:transglutaminase-like putative cysteine protease
MKFKISSSLSYDVVAPTTYFFNILVSKAEGQTILEESIIISPPLLFEEFTLKDSEVRILKLYINYGSFTINYTATVEVNETLIDENTLLFSKPLIDIDPEVLPFISPSRHCESDKLMKFALKEFGDLPNQFEKVKAINGWVFKTVEYVGGTTNSSTSACDTIISRQGVCKDFAHLGIALCRALDIPARYLTTYAANLNPPDIHACFEAYLGNQWVAFDPTRLSSPNKMVKIAHAKDASEVAVLIYYGQTICTNMDVQCDEVLG